jgi:translation initiation factor 5A
MEKKFGKVGQLKEGNYVLVDDAVCQIKGIEKSKPGKHGAAKARVTAIGVFDDVKRTLLKSTHDEAEIPIVQRGNAQVSAVMGETISLMDIGSYEVFECPKPKDVAGIRAGDEVEYIRVDQNMRILRKKGTA